jgi:integrase
MVKIMALSDTWLRTNSGKQIPKPIEKTDRDGMSVRVSMKGKIVFQLRFWHGGKQCRVDIGTYPLISLSEARQKLIKLKADVEQGSDPRITKKISKQANVDALTVSGLFYQWYESYCSKNKKDHEQIKRSFEIHLLPVLGKLPIDKIDTPDWCNFFDAKVKETESITARLLLNSKQMLSWGTRRRIIINNPLQSINAKADFNISKRSTNRVLSNNEIKLIWSALDNSKISLKNCLFVKLCLIYGCRNGELRLAKKEHFNFDTMTWLVPSENHKTGGKSGKDIVRPITSDTKQMIIELFELSGCDYLITSLGTHEPMSNSASQSVPYKIMQRLRKSDDVDMVHWSLHDLRRTARTNFSTLAPPHIAEIMLGHSLPNLWQVYDKHSYYDEQLQAYEAWIDRIKSIVGTI